MKSSSKTLMKYRVKFTIIPILLTGLVIYIILVHNPSDQKYIFSSQASPCSSVNPSTLDRTTYRDELDQVLAKVSTHNKTIIITIVNKAYCEGDKAMLDIFLDGFWIGENTRPLKDHLLVVTVDPTAYERCMFIGLHCYRLEINGADFMEEKMYMSKGFVVMMWKRTLFLGDVLKRGYNFIFTDTDVLWLRNPFPRLSSDETIDLQISTDSFSDNDKWNTDHLNTGFYFARTNNKTISLFDLWYSLKDSYPGLKEQDVLIKLMHKNVFIDMGITVRYLDTNYFSGFCQNSKDVRSVVTFHTNCCKSIFAKVLDLMTVIHDWKRYKGLSANEITTFKWSKYTNCGNSWDQ